MTREGEGGFKCIWWWWWWRGPNKGARVLTLTDGDNTGLVVVVVLHRSVEITTLIA